MLHDHVHRVPLPNEGLIFDGSTYTLPWDGNRFSKEPGPGPATLPTRDHAIYLVGAARFHFGPAYHLLDEESFMANLHAFYDSSPAEQRDRGDLWIIQFMLILAFGKSFTARRSHHNGHPHHASPPGIDIFCRALWLLPHQTALWRDPMISVEILCCISMYFNSLDHRMEAHLYVSYLVIFTKERPG